MVPDEAAGEFLPPFMRELSQLEDAIGHKFRDHELLVRALTHSSLSHERGSRPACHNEQLEFLGDSILGFIVSRELFKRFPDYSEGQLSKLKAQLVSSSHLHGVAAKLDMGEFLHLGRGEERSGGREKRALLADAMEAVIAAVYLDAGLRKAQSVLRRLILREVLRKGIDSFLFTDYKSALQEYLQSSRRRQPRYSVVAEHGPEHRKTFTVEVRVGDEYAASAQGPTKKMSEQEAAQAVLVHFREQDRVQAEMQASQAAEQQVPGSRFKVQGSGAADQVPGARCQVPGSGAEAVAGSDAAAEDAATTQPEAAGATETAAAEQPEASAEPRPAPAEPHAESEPESETRATLNPETRNLEP